MPLLHEANEANGYRVLIERTFKPMVDARTDLPQGGLAVIYDKNDMEASGYAATMADVFKEEVRWRHLLQCFCTYLGGLFFSACMVGVFGLLLLGR